jgi:uncharacterized protein (TIGR03086 family)
MTSVVKFSGESGRMTDPREYYERALAQTEQIVAAVRPDQLGNPTPCTEFDVRDLLRHIGGAITRAAITGEGGDALAFDGRGPEDMSLDTYRVLAKRATAAWSDDARLDAMVTVPWGTVPGRVALSGAMQEVVTHGWDLATATGQEAEGDPDLATWVLEEFAHRALPPERRGGPVPFGPVVPAPAGAGPYAQLAAWLGRRTG